MAALITLTGLAGRVLAADEQVLSRNEPTPAQNNPVATPQKATTEPPAATPVGAAELLKLAQAGVSPDVMKAYVEHAPVALNPSASDLVALKEKGVNDEVTMALIKRSAEAKPATGQMLNPRALNLLRSGALGGHLDPESYQYFQYYYLYPRTLSSMYDRLGYPPSPYYPFYPLPHWR